MECPLTRRKYTFHAYDPQLIRHLGQDSFLLISQHDHAVLSGALAQRVGGGPVARLSDAAIRGITLHDCGWPLHDDEPTLNPKGEPLHVFETPPIVATRVWSESARRAAAQDPYPGLLVSVHMLQLSVLSQASHRSPRDVFELNKFQHRQVELQESLRRQLGMRVDLPLTYGLAHPGASPQEDALLFDYRLLRAMDQLSLTLCCSDKLFSTIEGVYAGPGGAGIDFHLDRLEDFAVRLEPWPFDTSLLEFWVPYRTVAAGAFETVAEFRRQYSATVVQRVMVRVERVQLPVPGKTLRGK